MAGYLRLGRCGVVLLLVVGAVAPVAVADRAVAAPGRSAAELVGVAPMTAADAGRAEALAATSGRQVEILPDRTDFSRTHAEPQGGFEDAESLVPYQVHRPDGSWVGGS